MQYSGRTRLSVAVLLALALALLALAAPAGAATGDPRRAGQESLHIWAYFDGDTPVSGGRVRVYADGRRLRARDFGPGPARTFPGGMALLRFNSLPPTLRIVVTGGRAGGEPVRGTLKTKVRGVTDGELVHVNPVTTVSDVLARAEDGPGLGHARRLTERTLGIRPILDDHDLYVTDQWFEGDRFRRWTMEQGSVGAGARDLAQLIDQPGFDRRQFDPPDGGGPEARGGGASARDVVNRLLAAESGGATAAEVIGGLLDAVGGAAGLTGPEGFALSAALVVFKKLISLGLVDSGDKSHGGADELSAQLRAISAQLSQLQSRLDSEFLELHLKAAQAKLTEITNAQNLFLDMLKWAGVAENKKETPEVRNAASASLANSTPQFLKAAQDLQKEVLLLHQALIDEQAGTIKTTGLISRVRREVAKERFFTKESSADIRGFFRYFEWAQLNLATVRTEFYLLGGDCAKIRWDQHAPNDCPPDTGNAAKELTQIQANIEKQRATLPPRVLDPRVIIDTTTRRMWLLEPTYRVSPDILGGGIVFEQEGNPSRYSLYNGTTLFPNLDYQLGWGQGYQGWRIPTALDYTEGLFAGDKPGKAQPSRGKPLDRLDALGVTYNGKKLEAGSQLWLQGNFWAHRQKVYIGDRQPWVSAYVFQLRSGEDQPYNKGYELGTNCDFERRTYGPGGGEPPTVIWTPHCGGYWNKGIGAYILWWRGPMSDDQGGVYWCKPGNRLSWDPKEC